MIKAMPLSKKRWNHCKSVADFSKNLAECWNVDPTKAYLAGLLHDISRELPKEDFIPLAKIYDIPITKEDLTTPILLHGAISAVIAKENYGIMDEEILSAMAKHTLGDKEMSTLDKIIFLADKIEPLRQYDGVEELRKLAFKNIDQGLLKEIEQTERYLREQGITLHPKTLEMKERLLKEIN